MKRTYVYKLVVEWPNEADAWQWRKLRANNYLSRRGATERAKELRSHGAVVGIERSLPVEWPEATP